MSSAILYLAIVAIWAVVLVPRWLRPPSAAPLFADQSTELADGADESQADQAAVAESAQVNASGTLGSAALGSAALGSAALGSGALGSGESDAEAGHAPVRRSPAERHTDVLRARRRMLATLTGLTVGAVSLAVTGLAAAWVIIPPAGLLGFLLVLLREAARIDAEQAFDARRLQRAAQAHQAAVSRAGQEAETVREDVPASPPQAPAAPAAEVAEVREYEFTAGAEVIDISGRIGDQVYDQYSDAAERAVGD